MAHYAFRLLNVFAGRQLLGRSAFSGNPLCVFEDARGMNEREMMALARQFNLSETTFILPPSDYSDAASDAASDTASSTYFDAASVGDPPGAIAAARDHASPDAPSGASAMADFRVRIFTPTHDPQLAEMRFAGHPVLGSAHIARDLLGGGDQVTLELLAGRVPVQASGDTWTLTAPFEGAPITRAEALPASRVAALVGLREDDLAGPPVWMDTGMEQLLIPVRSASDVQKAAPSAAQMNDWPPSSSGRSNAYVFAFTGGKVEGRQQVSARFFIMAPGSGLYEDPGTGSACANLGGWLLHTSRKLPVRICVDQGTVIERPCRLLLDVTPEGKVLVGGRVVELATGTVDLPD